MPRASRRCRPDAPTGAVPTWLPRQDTGFVTEPQGHPQTRLTCILSTV